MSPNSFKRHPRLLLATLLCGLILQTILPTSSIKSQTISPAFQPCNVSTTLYPTHPDNYRVGNWKCFSWWDCLHLEVLDCVGPRVWYSCAEKQGMRRKLASSLHTACWVSCYMLLSIFWIFQSLGYFLNIYCLTKA